jgi:hypothetical protein
MGIDHGGFYVRMAEQFLYRPDIVAIFQYMGRERMPQCVGEAGLLMPASRTACFVARCKAFSC